MNRFSGKRVVITGASAGIGAAAARRFAAEGAALALAARTAGPLDAIAAELRARGGKVVPVRCDVGKLADCDLLVEQAVSELGGIDVLVNNAGANKRGPIEDHTSVDLAELVDVNLRAPVYLSRLVVPHMRRAGGGAIVNVASLAGFLPLADSAVYSATKFGLRAFGLALAEQLAGSGITVSSVSPGPVDTQFIMEEIDKVPDIVFSQPLSSADQVAAAVLDCAADGTPERALPPASGYLATLGYLVPSLRRALRPLMERRGRQVKDRLRSRP
jgi:short-subunit dehydrogenase